MKNSLSRFAAGAGVCFILGLFTLLPASFSQTSEVMVACEHGYLYPTGIFRADPVIPSNATVRVAWVKHVTVTNVVLMATNTFKATWPMETTTNLVAGSWTNEEVQILIPVGEEEQKFFRPRGTDVGGGETSGGS